MTVTDGQGGRDTIESEQKDIVPSTAPVSDQTAKDLPSSSVSASEKTDLEKYAPAISDESIVQRHQRKSYQFRAMARKTISYQKRQWFTNCCCLLACPGMMVVIAGVMGIVIQILIDQSAGGISNYLLCSNISAVDQFGFPLNPISSTASDNQLPTIPASEFPHVDDGVTSVYAANFLIFSYTSAGGSVYGNPQPCVKWFEHNYPYRQPYEPQPQSPDLLRKDTTNVPDPPSGWFSPQSLFFPYFLSQYQGYPWALVSDAQGVNSGTRPQQAPIEDPIAKLAPLLPLLINSSISLNSQALLGALAANPEAASVVDAFTSGATGSGLLGTGFTKNFYANLTADKGNNTLAGLQSVPGFNITAASGLASTFGVNISQVSAGFGVNAFLPAPFFDKLNTTSEADLDNAITNKIRDIIHALTFVNTTSLVTNASQEDSLRFETDVENVITQMPWGGLLFNTIDTANKVWDMIMQVGSDARLNSATNYPSVGNRRLALSTGLANGFLRTSNSSLTGASITHGFRAMPQLFSTKIKIPVATLAGQILYPFGISFLLPVFVVILVQEKERRILVMMKMNGLTTAFYYLCHYIHFFLLNAVATIVFIIIGLAFRMELFTLTDPGVYLLLLFIWTHVQIAMAFFFSTFFSKSRTALIVTFLIVLCGVVVSITTTYLFDSGAPLAYFIYTPLAFYYALSLINNATTQGNVPYKMRDLHAPDDVFWAMIFMAGGWLVWGVLAYYFNEVLPSEFGVRRPWYFPIRDSIRFCTSRRKALKKQRDLEIADKEGIVEAVDVDELSAEDDDVRRERQRVLGGVVDATTSPLVMKRMRKEYGSGKVAVKDVTFAVERDSIFGLLGPNGAGKTTLISILTGLYQPSRGHAFVSGYDIRTDMDRVYMEIGVCPQHDIQWDDLTVEEHVLFYARMKGIPAKREKEAVRASIEAVKLTNETNKRSKNLSGGQRRRLSIAISLVGETKVVFLDECTTGLDPDVRREIWTIILEAKKGRSIILTTHSMEEAEVLSNKIGIMAHGTLRAFAEPLRLKELYGRGFKLNVSVQDGSRDAENSAAARQEAIKYIESLLPANATKLDAFDTTVSYEFMPVQGMTANLFAEMTAHAHEHSIVDWGISQTSLDEVFLKIISDADADAEA